MYVCMYVCRDFSINALFYNLKSGLVEDLTGCGFEDLKKGTYYTDT
jgi:tRNA nucleotidyltransferase/poly(A) polymerase